MCTRAVLVLTNCTYLLTYLPLIAILRTLFLRTSQQLVCYCLPPSLCSPIYLPPSPTSLPSSSPTLTHPSSPPSPTPSPHPHPSSSSSEVSAPGILLVPISSLRWGVTEACSISRRLAGLTIATRLQRWHTSLWGEPTLLLMWSCSHHVICTDSWKFIYMTEYQHLPPNRLLLSIHLLYCAGEVTCKQLTACHAANVAAMPNLPKVPTMMVTLCQ